MDFPSKITFLPSVYEIAREVDVLDGNSKNLDTRAYRTVDGCFNPFSASILPSNNKVSIASLRVLSGRQIKQAEMSITCFENAWLVGQGLVITQDGQVFRDLSRPEEWEQEKNVSIFTKKPPKVTKVIKEPSALLYSMTAMTDNNSHWIVQCLPRIKLFEDVQIKGIKLVLLEGVKDYQKNILNKLGWENDSFIFRNPQEPIFFEKLFVPNFWNSFTDAGEFFDQLHGRIKPEPYPIIGEKIYVSRHDTLNKGIRRFLNELEVEALFKYYGFDIVCPGELPKGAEVAVFHKAKFVAGALGAGLCNCIYSTKGTHLLGFTDEDYSIYWYNELAFAKGFSLSIFFGEGIQCKREVIVHSDTHNNWIVDIELLEQALYKWLKKGGETIFPISPYTVKQWED